MFHRIKCMTLIVTLEIKSKGLSSLLALFVNEIELRVFVNA
jgi:hypothetical protein